MVEINYTLKARINLHLNVIVTAVAPSNSDHTMASLTKFITYIIGWEL